MNSPRADGLSSQDEFSTLCAIEDAFESEITDAPAIFVGRITWGGYRDFYFYARDAGDWATRVRRVMQRFSGYETEFDSRDDLRWLTYFDVLHPSAGELQTLKNRPVCDLLESQGDDLTQPRPILHWAYFSTENALSAFVERARTLGFELDGTSAVQESDGRCGARLTHIDIPSRGRIDEITVRLLNLATEFGGEYDGWETQIVSNPAQRKSFFGRLWSKTKH
jgi:regulator of RNase E activity RraB